MVICKYFLRGTCRFGENCKNEHIYNDNSGSVLRKKQDIDPNIIIKSVSNDMEKAENGNQWPFSCYGPFQGKSCFPGFEDKCFEEIRLGLYEAERNGVAEQYKQQLTQLLNETRMKMRSLQNPTLEATNVLKELFNSGPSETSPNSIFGNNPTNQSTIFGNTHAVSQNVFPTQQPTQPVAANTGSNFTFALPENKSIFGANNQISSGSIFSQNNQPTFPTNNNIFGGGPTKSIFANTQQNFPQNVFQTTTPSNQNFSPNTGSIFANQQNQVFPQQSTTGTNIFTHNSPFTQNNAPFTQNNTPITQNNAPFAQNTADPFRPQQNTTTTTESFKQNTDPFTQNVFQQKTVADTFQQNIPATQSLFPTSTFGQNSVLHSQNQGTVDTLAEHAKSIFGVMQSQVVESRRQEDTTIYSKIEDLSETDIKCFEGATFEFRKIPENPPTLKMC